MPFGSNSSAYTVVLVIGILLGGFIFFAFMPPRRRGKHLGSPSLLVLHDYFNFKIMIALWFIRFGYVVSACILTLYAIVMMFDVHFGIGIAVLVVGNIVLRLLMELSTVLLSIHSNLNQITDKILDRQPESVANVSAGEFFSDVSQRIKQTQEQMRAKAEAERRQYGQGNVQGGPPQYQPQGQPYQQSGQESYDRQPPPPVYPSPAPQQSASSQERQAPPPPTQYAPPPQTQRSAPPPPLPGSTGRPAPPPPPPRQQ